jgi:excisionase family DNA binding protein
VSDLAPLIDAKAAGRLLGVPHTWVLEEARHDRIPHIRLGRYVRFEAEALLAWARNRARGPAYPLDRANSGPGDVGAPRGLTPKG